MIKKLIDKLKILRLYFVIIFYSKKDDFSDVIQENEKILKDIDKFDKGF